MTRNRLTALLPRLCLFLIAAACISGIAPATADAAEPEPKATLSVRNNTGFEVLMLFVSAIDSDFFGPEVLGVETTLPDGDLREFTVHTDEECFDYDVLGLDVDGDMHFSIVELCPDEQTTVRLGEEGPLEDAPPLEHFVQLNIVNEHTETIEQLYASAVDGRYLGANLLGVSGPLDPGESRRVLLAESEAVSYNAVAVDAVGETANPTFHFHEHRGTGVEEVEVQIVSQMFESE